MTAHEQHFVVGVKRKSMFDAGRQIEHTAPVQKPINHDQRPPWSTRLERARRVKYASAIDFARHMGFSQQRYALYEKGEREPKYPILVQICIALDTTPDFILLGRESRQAA